MPTINKGRVNDEGNYEKFVRFSKAVLWKDRQLSLPVETMRSLYANDIPKMVFIDRIKKEKWTFSTSEVIQASVRKQVGQEPQIYFPIELAKVEPYEVPEKGNASVSG